MKLKSDQDTQLPSQMTVILPLLRELFEEQEIRSAQFVGFLSQYLI